MNGLLKDYISSQKPNKAHIIIGGNSQTGRNLKNVLKSSSSAAEIIVSTSRSETVVELAGLKEIRVGLDLSQKNSIQSIQKWIQAQVDVLGAPEVVLHLHAMSMGGIDSQYPENIEAEIQNYSESVRKILYISYEDEYDAVRNPKGSHVSYDARTVKQALESSINRLSSQHAIVDLIVFDSPSAKVLGPTFVGVVGDFIHFYKTHIDTREIGTIEKWFGKEFDGVTDFLKIYPLRGELSNDQKSMKDLASQGKFQEVINIWTKKMNFGSLSLVSGIISQVYLTLAMRYIKENEDSIVASGKRVLLTWEEICKNIQKEELDLTFENLFIQMHQRFSVGKSSDVLEENKVGIFIKNRKGNFILNSTYLSIINEHFGIVPMMLQHQLIEMSGTVSKDEYISSIKCPSQMYAGEEIKIIRKENQVLLVSASNQREIFAEVSISKKGTLLQEQKDGIILDRKSLETQEILENMVENIPHRGNWAEGFTTGVPSEVNGLKVSPSSSIIEFIGFKIGTLIKTQGDFLQKTFGVKKEELKKLIGIFGKVDINYLSDDFESVIRSNIFDIQIEKFTVRGGAVFVKINILQDTKIKAAFYVIGK